MNSIFIERFRELREQRGLKQKEIAEILHVQPSTISGWETGRNQPNYDILIVIARFFGVTIDYLLGMSNDQGEIIINSNLNDTENHLIAEFRKLKNDNQIEALNYIKYLITKK